MYGSEVWGIDYNGKLDTDPEELVQNKFLKWLLGVNKYCNNNACEKLAVDRNFHESNYSNCLAISHR